MIFLFIIRIYKRTYHQELRKHHFNLRKRLKSRRINGKPIILQSFIAKAEISSCASNRLILYLQTIGDFNVRRPTNLFEMDERKRSIIFHLSIHTLTHTRVLTDINRTSLY